jgi:hypothetical protein
MDLDGAALPLPVLGGHRDRADGVPSTDGGRERGQNTKDDEPVNLDEAARPPSTIIETGNLSDAAPPTPNDGEKSLMGHDEANWTLPATNGNGHHAHNYSNAAPSAGASLIDDGDGLIDLDEATLPLPATNGNRTYRSDDFMALGGSGANVVDGWDGIWAPEEEDGVELTVRFS